METNMSFEPIDPVSGNSPSNPYDPNNYISSSSTQGGSNDKTITGMAEAMHMSPEEVKKFVQQLIDTITTRIKQDTQQAVDAIKEATKEAQQQ